MKTVFVFFITGFEEIEALATVDILRRGGVNVKTVSLTGSLTVEGSHAVPVVADMLFEQVDASQAEMLVLPGGTPKYNEHAPLKAMLKEFYLKGNPIAAICASPMVFGGLGLLNGLKAVSYPGFEKYLEGATYTDQAVVEDQNIVTGKGPGFTFDFALYLLEKLKGEDKKKEVARALLLEK